MSALNPPMVFQGKHGENYWEIFNGDALEILKKIPNETFDCVITSPPYFWLRDYGIPGQIGLEDSVDGFVSSICDVMDEVQRVLKKTGLLFLNLGDTYYSGKGQSKGIDKKSNKRRFGLRAVDKSGGLGINLEPKSMIGLPWRVSIEMLTRGWTLRSQIIWYRKASLPEAVLDRPRRSYEPLLMFSKSKKYYFNRKPLEETEQEDMWTIVARAKSAAGLGTAPYPDELVKRCLDVGCPENGIVLDPFMGSGTTLRAALVNGRNAVGIDLNTEFFHFVKKVITELDS
jgi:DNA modification methylase